MYVLTLNVCTEGEGGQIIITIFANFKTALASVLDELERNQKKKITYLLFPK